jgi:hypothetical protein
MVPRYWVPLATAGGNDEVAVGGSTSAYDVVDRHSYTARMLVNMGDGAIDADITYRYAGLGNPLLNFSASQSVGYDEIVSGSSGALLGRLREWSRSAAAGAVFRRSRFRNATALSLGVDFERVTFDSDPAELLGGLQNFDPARRDFAGAFAGLGWSNTRRPSHSISPEDGVSLSVTVRERWRIDTDGERDASVVASLRAFKSLDLPGFAHHVIAARASLGAAARGSSRFSVGGKSGTRLELFPGYVIGDSPRNFPVRGFPSGAARGLRAATASLEYRAPLFMPSRGLGMFPLFFDRVSASFFADMGTAWCPASYVDVDVCQNSPRSASEEWIASAGAELNVDAALMYDSPYRLRVGVANIVRRPPDVELRPLEFYFTLGFPF